MEKDLIIGAFKNYSFETIRPWIKSINESGFRGDKVLISINSSKETNQKILNEDFAVVAENSNDQGAFHMERFFHIYNFLKINSGKYRYVITTDVRDVIFQSNPSIWLKNALENTVYNLVAVSESIKIKNEHWNRQNIINAFGNYFYNDIEDQDVYNVGTLAGTESYIKDLCGMLYQLSANRPDWVADQAAYNILLNWKPYSDHTKFVRLEDAWACNLHVTNKPDERHLFDAHLLEQKPIFEEGFVKDGKTKQPFCIVHQYDRDPQLSNFYKMKYNIEDVIVFRTDV